MIRDNLFRLVVSGFAVVLLLQQTTEAQEAPRCTLDDGVDLRLRSATIVDVRRGELLPVQDLFIEDGYICAITAAGVSKAPSAANVIDAEGLFVAPGLMEMHGHVSDAEAMTLYLANGVTTVRNLFGEQFTLALRDWLDKRVGEYPRLITAGPIVDGAPPVNYPFVVVTDAREADAEVARQAALGYDFVKIYSNLSPNVFDAVIAAGKKYDMEISGHLPHDVSFAHALDAGMRSMEHFLEVADELLRYPPTTDLDLYVVYPETQELLESIGRGEVAIDEIVDRSRIKEVAGHAGASETWLDPTLMPMRNFTSNWNTIKPAWQRYLSPAFKAYWQGALDAREGWSRDARLGEDQLYALRLELLGALHAAGAHVLAGTDAPVPGMYHGFSLVDEIQQLTRAGLSNADALRAATLEGARYLNREGELGEVVAGAQADLVLLKDNPLEDLQNLRSLVGVVRAGQWHTAEQLQHRLDGVAARYAAQEALFENAPALDDQDDVGTAEQVRTTAVKVGNKPVDFLGSNGESAARLSTIEKEGGLAIALSRSDGSGEWSDVAVSIGSESVTITREDGAALILVRADGGWELRKGEDVLWRLRSEGFVLPLTGTPIDIPVFARLLEVVGKPAIPLHVWHCDLAAACDNAPVAAYAESGGFEKLNAVFAGADRIDLFARGLGTTSLWVGAGPFYGGQPIRLQRSGLIAWERLR